MKGKIFIRIGILFIAAAVALTIYNVYEGYRADRSSSQVMELLRKKKHMFIDFLKEICLQ